MNPAFIAKQLGHGLEVFFRDYAKWIDDAKNDREMDKIESKLRQIGPDVAPNNKTAT